MGVFFRGGGREGEGVSLEGRRGGFEVLGFGGEERRLGRGFMEVG